MGRHAIVIGGGVGGLSAAMHLATRGVRVTLLEKNARLGGILNRWEIAHPSRTTDRPFSFDTGPSHISLPLIFQDLFAAAGEDVRNYLPIIRLDPIARYFWRDGTVFDLRGDEKSRESEIARLAPSDVSGLRRILERGARIWNSYAEAAWSHAPADQQLAPAAFLQRLVTSLRIGAFSSYSRLVDREIQKPKLRQILHQLAANCGCGIARNRAAAAVMPFIEICFGAWYIPGGIYRLVQALEQVAKKLGVEIRTECAHICHRWNQQLRFTAAIGDLDAGIL